MVKYGILSYEGWHALYVDGGLASYSEGNPYEMICELEGLTVVSDPDYLYGADDPDDPPERWPYGT